jgi:protein translocase SecG subunit
MELGLSILLILTSVLMIVLVLLHKGKGSGLSDLFGGGVSSTYGGSHNNRCWWSVASNCDCFKFVIEVIVIEVIPNP